MEKSSEQLRAIAEGVFNLRSETMPTWIDNSSFAYLDDRSGVPQLFVANFSSVEDPKQLTQGEERIQSLIGGAGDTLIVGTDVGGDERQQLRSIVPTDGSSQILTSAPDKMFEPFLVSNNGDEVVYRTNDGESGEFSLWSHHLATGTQRCLWPDAGQVRAHDMNAKGDVLASLLTSNLDADLYIVHADGSREVLLQSADESWILDAAFLQEPAGLLVLTNADHDFLGLQLVDQTTGQRSTLIQADGDIEAFKLSPDGKRLAYSVNDGGYSRVFITEVDAPDDAREIELPPGVLDRFSWSPDGTRVVFGWVSPTTPSRIYMIDAAGSARPALPDKDGNRRSVGVAPETIAFETFDGREIPAFWFPAPPGDDAPVVIDVHGGPESQRRPGFHPTLQYLVACGFNVLSTNVRGSTGYGKAFSHLDDVEKRLDSVRDLEAAHRWVLERSPGFAGRVAIMGQSYGGFMTLSAITEYPDLWYAAVDIVGICNFVTFLERTGPWRRRHREAEYGSLERDRELLVEISPIRKVDRITAPLQVIHGRNDPRVPLYEAEQLVASLEARQHPVQLHVFDNEGHGLSKRPNRIDGYVRVAEFLWSQAEKQGER